MALIKTTFENTESLNDEFAKKINSILTDAIAQEGRASIAVSGGRTPIKLFQTLSSMNISWSKVDVTLVDERWVSESHEASNTLLVKTHLLQNEAAAANFISLKTNDDNAFGSVDAVEQQISAIKQPFDVMILGMGEDGHTASLFPCSKELKDGLDMNSGRTCIAVQPTTAPHSRMSFTLPVIVSSKNIFLHLTGQNKLDVLDEAMANYSEVEKPINAVINRAPVTLMWTP